MKRSLEESLREPPELRARFEQMLDLVENSAGDCVRADEAELRLLEQVRGLGRELLQDWAAVGQERVARACVARHDTNALAARTARIRPKARMNFLRFHISGNYSSHSIREE
jgi:hypothetical protein